SDPMEADQESILHVIESVGFTVDASNGGFSNTDRLAGSLGMSATTTRPFSPRRSLPSCVSDRSSARGLALELAANAEAP
ncbi:hypothetical protein KUCAC02_029618, partial [Chaenocephalus aceratus]